MTPSLSKFFDNGGFLSLFFLKKAGIDIERRGDGHCAIDSSADEQSKE